MLPMMCSQPPCMNIEVTIVTQEGERAVPEGTKDEVEGPVDVESQAQPGDHSALFDLDLDDLRLSIEKEGLGDQARVGILVWRRQPALGEVLLGRRLRFVRPAGARKKHQRCRDPDDHPSTSGHVRALHRRTNRHWI